MSKLGKETFTPLDLNGPYLRIDTQPTSVTKESIHGNGGSGRESRYTATFTSSGSIYFMIGDEADIGDNTVIEEDAVSPTVINSGAITYQWYEMIGDSPDKTVDNKLVDGRSNPLPIKHRSAENNTDIATTGSEFSNTTSTSLTITDLQSPGDNARQFYCSIDYVVSEDSQTGNLVNSELTTDIATITVLPHIVIDKQPDGGEAQLNTTIDTSFSSRLSDNRFTNDLAYQWYEVNENGTLYELSDLEIISNPILDETKVFEYISLDQRVEEYTKTTIEELKVPLAIPKKATIYGTKVGIPTQVSKVTVKLAGGSGGKGGDEGNESEGGESGNARYGEFSFNAGLIERINNSKSPQDFVIFAGSAGGQGPPRTNEINSFGAGGICASTYDESSDADASINGKAGDGGHPGPDGLSGAGGGGGGFSGIFDNTAERWLAIAGGGGGGGGGSELRPGANGSDSGEWEEVISDTSIIKTLTAQATVVNFNPRCTEVSGETIKIDYGFYTKTTTSNNQVLQDSDVYDRLIIIWDGNVKYDKSDSSAIKEDLNEDADGVYIEIANIKYYVGTHRGSELGWCDVDDDCGVCTRLKSEADDVDNRIDLARNRRTGGYANSFDLIRVETPSSEGEFGKGFYGAYGINGADKVSGDGGGGGGGGAGAFTDSRGGNAGTDAVNNAQYQITVSVEANSNISDDEYINFIPVESGDTISFKKSDKDTTSNITFTTGAVYDVVSSIDEGLTSEGIRVLPNLNRSIGLDLSGSVTLDEIPKDIFLSFGEGVFQTVPRTVFVDGEFIGASIIQFVVPSDKTVNQTAAEGGGGGRSAYLVDNVNKHHLDFKVGGKTVNGAEGYSELKFTTIEGFDVLNDTVNTVELSQKHNHNGTKTQILRTKSEYTFSKVYKCRIFSNICSPVPQIDTREVTIFFTDSDKNVVFVEAIGTDDFAHTYSRNLNNIDLNLYPSTEIGTDIVKYYSLYTKYDTDVDIRLRGGQGKSRTYGSTTHPGGLGGMSYFRLRMKANTEYVIAGLDSNINTPFLFEKASLLAVVGSGGDAGNTGSGGSGSGIKSPGGDAPSGGGKGAQIYFTLRENGVYGSASIATDFSPGDSKQSGNSGGYTKKCTTGKYWSEQNISPCADVGTSEKFRLGDGTEVVNTAEISRGFKDGYNIFVTGGLGSSNIGNGGNGAGGGSGSIRGGGGGSGYANEKSNFFLRQSTNIDDSSESPDGTYAGSSVGVNEGQPHVEISLADIETSRLEGFSAYPDDIIVGSDQLTLFEQGLFEPLPIIEAPENAIEPVPITSISAVYVNNVVKDIPLSGKSIDVDEGSTIKVEVQTKKIPPNSKLYWKLTSGLFDSSGRAVDISADDTNTTVGEFTTSFLDDPNLDHSTCQGSFEFSILNDLFTEFVTGEEKFGINVYSDSDRTNIITSLHNSTFNIGDISRSAPTAKITTTPVSMSEGDSQTFFVETTNIPIFPDIYPAGDITLNWEIINLTTTDNDFVATSGTFDIVVSDPENSVTGTGSFTVTTKEDFTTEGSKIFSLKISYAQATQHPVLDSTTLVYNDDGNFAVTINDTSLDPVYTLSPSGASMDEHKSNFASGDTETYTLATEYVRSGSTFYFQVVSGHDNTSTSDSIETDDFNTSSGTFTVSGNTLSSSGTFDIVTKPDALSESAELFTVQVYKTTQGDYDNATVTFPADASLVTTQNLTVNNTTETVFLLHENGNANTKSKTINEGEALTLNVYGRFTATNPEIVYWRIYKSNGSTTADSSDWDATSGSVDLNLTDNEGNATFTITPANDAFTDGDVDEKFFVKLSLSSNYSTKIPDTDESSGHLEFEVDVRDTSRNPIYKFQTDDGFEEEFTMDEGNSKNMLLIIDSISVGTVFYWEILKTHNTGSRVTSDDADWQNTRGTVTSTSLEEHQLSWTINGLADSSTEGSSDSLNKFTIRLTTGNYYSESGSQLDTGSNTESIDNDGRIKITLRDTSKAPATYSISSGTNTYEKNEVDYAQTYTITALDDTRGGIDGDGFNLFYSIVHTGTTNLAEDDIISPYGTLPFNYFSLSSNGLLKHTSDKLSVNAINDFIKDDGDEEFDLLLFDSETKASSPTGKTALASFQKFFRIDDTSFPAYAIRQDFPTINYYNTTIIRTDTTLSFNEGLQDSNGNPEWSEIYMFSNQNENFNWQLKLEELPRWHSLTFSDNIVHTKSGGTYSGILAPIKGSNQSSVSISPSDGGPNYYYASIKFWVPRDFSSNSAVEGTFKLYTGSNYSSELVSSDVNIRNKFSIPNAPTVSTPRATVIYSSQGATSNTSSTHYYARNADPIILDPDGEAYVKGADAIDVHIDTYTDNTYTKNSGGQSKSWSKTNLKWLEDDATSSNSSNYVKHYLKDLFDDWQGYKMGYKMGSGSGWTGNSKYDNNYVRILITATNPGTNTKTLTKSIRLDKDHYVAPTPTPTPVVAPPPTPTPVVAPTPTPTPVVKRYRVYPLWRYYRTGSNKMDRYAHNPSYTFQDFMSLPTTMPPGAPGEDTNFANSNRTAYRVEGALGGVFLGSDRPSDAVYFTSIQSKLDTAMDESAKVGWYCFNTKVVGSKLMAIYESNTNWKKNTIERRYHLRDVGDTNGLEGWLTTNRNAWYKFYLMNGIYQEPNGTWWWDDTR